MASPVKSPEHCDGSVSVNFLGHIRNVEYFDMEPNVSLNTDYIDMLIEHELGLDEDPYETGLDLNESLKELSFPYLAQEPKVSAEELARLDELADKVEVRVSLDFMCISLRICLPMLKTSTLVLLEP